MRKFAVAVIVLIGLVAGYQVDRADYSAEFQARINTMYRQYARKLPTVKEITVAELQQLQRQEKK